MYFLKKHIKLKERGLQGTQSMWASGGRPARSSRRTLPTPPCPTSGQVPSLGNPQYCSLKAQRFVGTHVSHTTKFMKIKGRCF